LTGLVLLAFSAVAQPAPPPPRFELVILEGRWDGANWPDPGGPRFFSVGIDDVDAYQWSSQTFTLSSACTERLARALAQAPGPGASIIKLNALKETLGHGDSFDRSLYLFRFVVVVEGEPLYWGIFLDPPSQMGIDYPVIRSEMPGGKAVFHVLPVHVPFFTSDPGTPESLNAVARESKDVPGGIMDHFRSLASTPAALAFRERIRDPRLKQVFESAKKLQP
jgi:hypothetical protein